MPKSEVPGNVGQDQFNYDNDPNGGTETDGRAGGGRVKGKGKANIGGVGSYGVKPTVSLPTYGLEKGPQKK